MTNVEKIKEDLSRLMDAQSLLAERVRILENRSDEMDQLLSGHLSEHRSACPQGKDTDEPK